MLPLKLWEGWGDFTAMTRFHDARRAGVLVTTLAARSQNGNMTDIKSAGVEYL
jgi:hypothetical protein